MLVLRRQINERIMVGGNIIVTLVDSGRGWARLGITAPKDVKVMGF